MGDTSDIPRGILPPCDVDYVSERIVLWSGTCELIKDQRTMTGQGTVEVDLLPSPRTRFSFQNDEDWSPKDWHQNNLGDAELTAGSPVGRVKVWIQKSDGHEFSGEIRRNSDESETDATSARFLVVNGPRFNGEVIRRGKLTYAGRLEAEIDHCQLFVDQLTSEKPPGRSVFAFTHVSELTFESGVSARTIDAMSATLSRTLSLMQGRWVGLVGPWLYSSDETLLRVVPAVTRTT